MDDQLLELQIPEQSTTNSSPFLTISIVFAAIVALVFLLKRIFPEKFKIPERFVPKDQDFEYQTVNLTDPFDENTSDEEGDDAFRREIKNFDINDHNYL